MTPDPIPVYTMVDDGDDECLRLSRLAMDVIEAHTEPRTVAAIVVVMNAESCGLQVVGPYGDGSGSMTQAGLQAALEDVQHAFGTIIVRHT